jgi:hypothetical protein
MTSLDPTCERLARLRRILAQWTQQAAQLAHDDRQELAVHWGEAVADLEGLIRKVEKSQLRDLALI